MPLLCRDLIREAVGLSPADQYFPRCSNEDPYMRHLVIKLLKERPDLTLTQVAAIAHAPCPMVEKYHAALKQDQAPDAPS
jgi:hypothetical protein